MARHFLAGKISGGMFPTERAVTIQDQAGRQIAVIAHDKLVQDGRLEVTLLSRTEDSSNVLLPGDVYGSGQVITVDTAALVEA